jgi:hypothetical protein
MSRQAPFVAANSTTIAWVTTALLSLTVQAATPHVLPHSSTTTKRNTVPPAPPPLSTSKPPAVRSLASFTRQTPLSEAIGLLRDSTTPPLKIIVLWRPLNSAGIYADTPIGIDGVAGSRAGQVLDLLVLSLSAGASTKIGYVVDRGVITISTTETLPAPKLVACVHDISDLVAPPARYSLQSMGVNLGYGGPMMPLGGYSGNLGAGPVYPAGGTPTSTRQITRTYRSR